MRLRVQQIDLTDGTSGEWFARAHIVVSAAAEDPFDPGATLLSSECLSVSEVIEEADRMISELERIKVEASKRAWNSVAARGEV
jgi:hypothetical protein